MMRRHFLFLWEDDSGDNGASDAADASNTNDAESNQADEQTTVDDDFSEDVWNDIQSEVEQSYGDITTDNNGPDIATQQYAEDIADGTASWDSDTAQSVGRGGDYSVSSSGNIYDNGQVLTDSNGNPITTKSGEYWYTGDPWGSNGSSEDPYGSKQAGMQAIANERAEAQAKANNNATSIKSDVNDQADKAAKESEIQGTSLGQSNHVSTAIDEDEKAHLSDRQVYDQDILDIFNNAKDLDRSVMDFSNNNGRGYGNADIAKDANGVSQYGSVDRSGNVYSKDDYYSNSAARQANGQTNAQAEGDSSLWGSIKNNIQDKVQSFINKTGDINQALGGKDEYGRTGAQERREERDNQATAALTNRYNDLADKASKGSITSKEQKELDALENRYGTNLGSLQSNIYQNGTQTNGGRLTNILDNIGEKLTDKANSINSKLGGSDKYGLNEKGQFVDRNGDGKISLAERAQNIGSNVYNAAKDKLNDLTNPFQREEALWNEGKSQRQASNGDLLQNIIGGVKQAGAVGLGGLKTAATAAVNPAQAIMELGVYGANKLGNKVLTEAERHDIQDLASSKSSPSSRTWSDNHNDDSSDDDVTAAIASSLKKPKAISNAVNKIANKQAVKTDKYDTIINQHRKDNATKISSSRGTISDERLKSFVIAAYTNPAIASRYGKMLMLSTLTNNNILTRRS